jgi:ABC-type branched-subunit amino acid transport system substrate-binding protein
VSPQVTAVAQGADAVVSDVAPAQNQQVLAARTQLGISAPFLTATGVLSNDAVKSLGPSAEGIKLASALPTDDVQLPGNTTYLADMKALRAQHYGDAAKMAWVSIDLLNTAVKGLTTLNRSTILAALNRVTSYDAGGLAGVSGLADFLSLITLGEDFSKKGYYQRVCAGERLAILRRMMYYLEYGIDRREEAWQQDLLLPG